MRSALLYALAVLGLVYAVQLARRGVDAVRSFINHRRALACLGRWRGLTLGTFEREEPFRRRIAAAIRANPKLGDFVAEDGVIEIYWANGWMRSSNACDWTR